MINSYGQLVKCWSECCNTCEWCKHHSKEVAINLKRIHDKLIDSFYAHKGLTHEQIKALLERTP